MFLEQVTNLVGQELSFNEFQGAFNKLGFIVEEEKKYIEAIIENEKALYTHILNDDWKIEIFFDVTERANEEEEHISATYVKITDIF